MSTSKGREHVVPEWLLSHLQLRTLPITLQRLDENAEVVRSRLQCVGGLILGRRICDTCNNGWMATLEGTAKQLITAMVDGALTETHALTEPERNLVGRWMVKTAYALAFYMDFHWLVPESHCRKLVQCGNAPTDVAVLFSTSPIPNPCHLWFGSSWPIVMRDDYPDVVLKDALTQSYKVAIQLQHLCFVVCHWSLPGFSIGLIENFHQVICPPQGAFRNLGPGTLPNPIDETTILRELVESTAVFEDSLSTDEIVFSSARNIRVVHPEMSTLRTDPGT